MPATYENIATTTLTNNTTDNITFSSIANTYTDLRVILVCSVSTSTGGAIFQVNGDTGTNYSFTELDGNGSTAGSYSMSNQIRIYLNYGADTMSTIPVMFTIDSFSYAGSTNKSFLITESNDQNGAGQVTRAVALWRSTSAITSIKLSFGGGNFFKSGATATLYGIKSA